MTYDYTNKSDNVANFVRLMYTKTLTMFHYDNMPDSLPAIEIERMLQRDGYAVVTKFQGEPTAFKATLSGENLDVYGRPTIATIANPLYSATTQLNKDSVLIKNDDEQQGLGWLFEKYGCMINETDISMVVATFNKRMQTLISASDDNTVDSARAYLKEVTDGRLGVIADSKLFDSLRTSPTTTNASNNTADIVELQQYLKATLLNEIGVNANYNMKRERLTDDEVQANTDNLKPLVDNMLENRKNAAYQLNLMFGTNIQVELASVWGDDDEPDSTDGSSDDSVQGEPDTQDDTNSVVHDILDYLTSPDDEPEKVDPEPEHEPDDEGSDDDETERTDNDK